MVAAGTTYTAVAAHSPVAMTTYRLGARWCAINSDELAIPGGSMDLFVNGTRGTRGERGADPTEAASASLYLGSDTVETAINGELTDIHFSQVPWPDSIFGITQW